MLEQFISTIGNATLTLPAMEVCVLLVALALCLVFRMTRLGLVVGFVFIYRWGWMLIASRGDTLLVAYAFFGIAVLILTVLGLVAPRRKS